jgi:hypothetical protein
MAGHIATAARVDWNTPPDIVAAVHQVFGGPPDLDPCSNPSSLVNARRNVMLPEDGLTFPWEGKVYVNPPYGKGIDRWIQKASESVRAEVILLIPASVSAHYWHRYVLGKVSASCPAKRVCFIRGRLRFVGADSTAPFPAAVVYWGTEGALFDAAFSDKGWIVTP